MFQFPISSFFKMEQLYYFKFTVGHCRTHLCSEAMVDCVGKPQIFIQCSCLIAPLPGYDSAL